MIVRLNAIHSIMIAEINVLVTKSANAIKLRPYVLMIVYAMIIVCA